MRYDEKRLTAERIELELLRLQAAGKTSSQIAYELYRLVESYYGRDNSDYDV